MSPIIELISTGSELLSGRSVNTHARLLGGRLRDLGFELERNLTLGDRLDALVAALRDSVRRSDIVCISGGLGPTEDDLTREALAQAFDRPLVESPEAVADLLEQYGRRRQELTASRRKQALILKGAAVLLNSVGAAPGQRIALAEGKQVFVLPGPPPEFEAIMKDHIIPWLVQKFPKVGKMDERLFLTTGIGESDIVEKIESGQRPAGIELAYCAGPNRVEVRLTGESSALDAAETWLEALLGGHVYARERIELEEAVGRALAERRMTLAVAESCTGGLLGAKLTSVSGSSAFFKGGIISYANEAKEHLLGVSAELLVEHGAVSEPVACAMAEGARKALEASIGVAITGIAGPTGGTEEKPVGLVHMAVADEAGTEAVHRVFHGNRALVRERACLKALDLVRSRIVKNC